MSSVRERLERAQRVLDEYAAPKTAVPETVISMEQDPSMPDRPTAAVPEVAAAPATPLAPPLEPATAVAEPVEAPAAPVVPAAPAAPAELPEQRYEYQPTDENGRPIGGRQVIKYRTQQELVEGLAKQNTLILRELRKVNRERAIGVPEKEDDAEKFSNVVEFKPRDLSADERFKLAQELVNPESFAEARDKLIESAFGAKPAVLASTLNDTQKFMIQQRAVQNYIEFVQATGFVDNLENRELLTSWVGKRNLAPTVANFVLAQKRLKEAGLLQEAPVVQQEPVAAPVAPVATPAPVAEEPKPQVPPATPPALAAAPEAQAKRHSHVPSGLTPSVASPAGDSPVQGPSLTLADIDKLPAAEYKQRMKDPKFVELVNQLEADAAKRRRARAMGQ